MPQPPTAPARPAPTSPYFGLWIDHTGDGAVEIGPCGDNGTDRDRLCGRIFWLKNPLNDKGQPLRDGYNEDERQRKRPICGLPILSGLKRQADGTYDEGTIYDPRQGKSFSVELSLKAPDKLQVMGYKGMKWLSKTFMWQRANGGVALTRCTPPPAA